MSVNYTINTIYSFEAEKGIYKCTIELKILTLADSNQELQDVILSNQSVMYERLHKSWGYFKDNYRIREIHPNAATIEELVLLVLEIKEELHDTLKSIVRLNKYNEYLCSTHNNTEKFTIN